MYNKILVPIDIVENELNQKVINHVETFASCNQSNQTEIHFLSVLPNLEIFLGIEIATLPESQHDCEERSRVVLELLKEMVKKVNLPHGKTICKIGIGSVKDEILDYTADMHADLILIGSHSPSSTSHLLGSTTASIVRHAQMIVLGAR
ncbi:MAG TPA: universal stress protein [Arsenophonus sp.]